MTGDSALLRFIDQRLHLTFARRDFEEADAVLDLLRLQFGCEGEHARKSAMTIIFAPGLIKWGSVWLASALERGDAEFAKALCDVLLPLSDAICDGAPGLESS